MGSSPLRLRLLGGFGVTVGNRAVPESAWRLRKAKSLLKLLALAPDRRLHRERAAELLWPDRAADSAANNLHQALYVARRALEARGGRRPGVSGPARRHAGAVRGPARSRSTSCVFEEAAEAARAAGTRRRASAARSRCTAASCCPRTATRTGRRPARGAARAPPRPAAGARPSATRRTATRPARSRRSQRAVVDDPLHEEAHRRLMRLFAEAGRRQQALAQYQQLRQTPAPRIRGRSRPRDPPPLPDVLRRPGGARAGDPAPTSPGRRARGAGRRGPRRGPRTTSRSR